MDIILIYLLHGIVAAFLFVAALHDARKREVGNWISIGIMICSIILMAVKRQIDLSGIIPGIIMATLYLLGFDKQFRGADIKLLTALGLYLSFMGCLLMLFIASFTSLLYEGVRYIATHEKRMYIPFCTWMGITGTFILAVQII